MTKPDPRVEDLPTYRQVDHPDDELKRALSALARRHGLLGVMLIQVDGERWGCRSWGIADSMMRVMDGLGSRTLVDLSAGRHDDLLPGGAP